MFFGLCNVVVKIKLGVSISWVFGFGGIMVYCGNCGFYWDLWIVDII